jgi:hypothetical protein
MGMAKRACLSASLLTSTGWALPENLPARTNDAPAARDATASLFFVKEPAALDPSCAAGATKSFAVLPLGSRRQRGPVPALAKFSLRLSEERRAAMKQTAAHLGQSCQCFLLDALNAHIARVLRGPGNEPLRLVRFETTRPA